MTYRFPIDNNILPLGTVFIVATWLSTTDLFGSYRLVASVYRHVKTKYNSHWLVWFPSHTSSATIPSDSFVAFSIWRHFLLALEESASWSAWNVRVLHPFYYPRYWFAKECNEMKWVSEYHVPSEVKVRFFSFCVRCHINNVKLGKLHSTELLISLVTLN